jgi:hypothetical protein
VRFRELPEAFGCMWRAFGDRREAFDEGALVEQHFCARRANRERGQQFLFGSKFGNFAARFELTNSLAAECRIDVPVPVHGKPGIGAP